MWPMVSLTLTTLQPADPKQTRVQDTNGGCGCEESGLAAALQLRARYHSSKLEYIKEPQLSWSSCVEGRKSTQNDC